MTLAIIRKESLHEMEELNGPESQTSTQNHKMTQAYRTKLPHRMHSSNEFSIWAILKQAVGMDLTRLTMPVIFNEPLSFIQRLSEYLEYCNLLHEAAITEDPVKRLMLVTTYMVSCYAPVAARFGKPFNPLLGETFEMIRDDLGIKLIAEQVSHHPPISAVHAEGKSGFSLELCMEPRVKFWGKSIEVKPKGQAIIKIPKYDEVYSFSFMNSSINNIIIGSLWLELYGQCKIRNRTTGHTAYVQFKPAGWFSRGINQVEGHIADKNDAKIVSIKGDWTKYVCSCPAKDANLLHNIDYSSMGDSDCLPPSVTLNWKAVPKPKHADTMYNMTEFAMGLNELLDTHKDVLAPTDCRYRPDIRCLESGDMDGACEEKVRLEEKQRATRKIMEAKKEIWKPRWFAFDYRDDIGTTTWTYNGDYFKRDYSNCPDIY